MSQMELAQLIFKYELVSTDQRIASSVTDQLRIIIIEKLKEESMAILYSSLCNKYDWSVEKSVLSEMSKKNETTLESIEAKLQDAIKNAGDMEVIDIMILKGKEYAKTGCWGEAGAVFDEILSKPKTSTGKKIDVIMDKAKMALFLMNSKELKELIASATKLNDIGGDWDRRNRLKVFEAFYLLSIREIRKAASLFMECVATFTCTELCSYKQFMFYALVTSTLALNRNELRKKVINDAHVITAIHELPDVQSLINGIYHCDYKGFFEAVEKLHPSIVEDRFLNPVSVFLVREFRVLAYSQFLESYKSVMLSSMASAFNITPSLLDAELSRFIAAGRLNAKIDKVGDIIETSRSDKKSAQFQEVVKRGDLLLNRIQKLVRIIDV